MCSKNILPYIYINLYIEQLATSKKINLYT